MSSLNQQEPGSFTYGLVVIVEDYAIVGVGL